MADPDPARRPGPARLWQIVLVLSLALNLAVAGVVAGTVLSGRTGDGSPRSFDLGIGPVAQALDRQERREVGRMLRQARVLRDVNPRGRVAEMIAVLQTEPLDADLLRAIFAQQAADVARLQLRAQEALLTTIMTMSPERRAAFAAALAEQMERAPGRGLRPSGG
ncbi:periplasmic heavy metal sensor [Yoonia sp.]|uniref:periplasmic heavy metal sensor n=1 Tax=Yoonia sp. TaxID=2212373 RepID=UPI002FD9E217